MVNTIYVLSIKEIGEPDLDFFVAYFVESCPDWNVCSGPPFFVDLLFVNMHKKNDLKPEQRQYIVDCSLRNIKREAGDHKSGRT